ncbi:GntR family transcriptional regulator [Christensenellaceae bacterium OttesenSCG-928-M15]|nr:GntR family transcriptional regulator [Christensenellaceae bacterium OttesenSCG-928-M15]
MEQSKYASLANSLREDIFTGKYQMGEKLPSENELCKELRLSRQTIRQAIGVLEQEGIVERRQGSGTYIASIKRDNPRPTKNIGIISTYMDSYIFPAIIKGIDAILAENGYMMQLALTHNQVENEARAIQMLLEKDVDGLIVEPTKSGLPNPNMHWYGQVKRRKIPLIFFNAYYAGLDFPHVCLDDFMAGKKAAQCLIDAGHKSIAGMFQSDDRQGHLRYAGFMEALSEAGLEPKSSNVFWFVTEDIPYLAEDISRVKRSLQGCTGLVCYNDQIAYTIVTELLTQGCCIPDELSVVGIDNAEIAIHCEVPLTTLTHPMEELGRAAARNILELIKNPNHPATIEFEPELVRRASVRTI